MRYLFLALILLPGVAPAAEFSKVEVTRAADVYTVEIVAELDAAFDAVHAVVTDYRHLHWVNSAIKESAVLENPAPDIHIVRTYSRMCFLFFCQSVEHVQRVDDSNPTRIVSETLPEKSDLKEGRGVLELLAIGENRTRLNWHLSMQPDFWVPPLIGPAGIKRSLKEQARYSVRSIEKLAKERTQAK